MIKFVLLCLVCVSPFIFSPQLHAKSTILLLGDSLSASYGMKESQGWVSLLNQQLMKEKRQYEIINASISGETSAGGLARLPNILKNQPFDYLLIELGANDGLRGFPPALTQSNLSQIITIAQAKGIKVLLMQIKIPPNYGPRYNKMFEGIYPKLVQEHDKVTLLPFFMESIATQFAKTGNTQPELMLPDGLHPNETAQPLIAEMVGKQLQAIIP